MILNQLILNQLDVFLKAQAYNAGLAASGVATTLLRMVTKVAFGDGTFGLRKGACEFLILSFQATLRKCSVLIFE